MAEDSGCGTLIVLGFVALSIYSCSNKDAVTRSDAEQAVITGDAPSPGAVQGFVADVNPVRADFSTDRAEDAARDYVSGETYQSIRGSLDCTDDCSGHEAGWQWAKDGNSCGSGDSESFDAGCRAYEEAVEEKTDDARSRYDEGDDTFAGDE